MKFTNVLRRARWAVLGIACLVPLAGCSSDGGGSHSTQSSVAKQGSDVLRISTPRAPVTMDPALAGNGDAWALGNMLTYDPLIYLDPDGKLVPGLATKWTWVGSGNTVFDLTLRKGVKFSDGTELTAQGVKDYFAYFAQAGGVYSDRAAFKSVDVTGPLSLRITLTAPNPELPYYFTQSMVLGDVISPKGLQNPKGLATTTSGAGQYVLDPDNSITGQKYTFVVNEHYWNPSAIHFKKVTLTVLKNSASTLDAMKSGQIDYMFGDLSTVGAAKSAGFDIVSQPASNNLIILMDREGEKTPALGSLKVRQALNYAIDRKTLAKALFGSYGKASGQFVLPGNPAADPALNSKYDYDPAKAKKLLKEAGYADGFSMSIYALGEEAQKQAQAVGGYWAEIGVKLEVKVPTDVNAGIKNSLAKDYAAMVASISSISGLTLKTLSGIDDPEPGFYNPFGSSDPKISKLLAEAAAAPPDETDDVLKKLQQRMVDLAWFVPIATSDKILIIRPGLKGVKMTSGSLDPDPIFFSAG